MVKLIIAIGFICLFYVCLGQKNAFDNEIKFNASVSCESILMEDSLDLFLSYRNTTNDSFCLYPKAFIGLGHIKKVFITYEKAERIALMVNNQCDYDTVVVLEHGEKRTFVYTVKADSNFFYFGENEVYVFYRFYDKSSCNLRRKKYGKLKLSLNSSPITVNIIKND